MSPSENRDRRYYDQRRLHGAAMFGDDYRRHAPGQYPGFTARSTRWGSMRPAGFRGRGGRRGDQWAPFLYGHRHNWNF